MSVAIGESMNDVMKQVEETELWKLLMVTE